LIKDSRYPSMLLASAERAIYKPLRGRLRDTFRVASQRRSRARFPRSPTFPSWWLERDRDNLARIIRVSSLARTRERHRDAFRSSGGREGDARLSGIYERAVSDEQFAFSPSAFPPSLPASVNVFSLRSLHSHSFLIHFWYAGCFNVSISRPAC